MHCLFIIAITAILSAFLNFFMSRGEGGKLTKVHRERQWQNQHLAHKYTVFCFAFSPASRTSLKFSRVFQKEEWKLTYTIQMQKRLGEITSKWKNNNKQWETFLQWFQRFGYWEKCVMKPSQSIGQTPQTPQIPQLKSRVNFISLLSSFEHRIQLNSIHIHYEI